MKTVTWIVRVFDSERALVIESGCRDEATARGLAKYLYRHKRATMHDIKVLRVTTTVKEDHIHTENGS